MRLKSLSLAFVLILAALATSCASGQSIEVAKDYYQHGLNDRAKDVLITLLHSTSATPTTKAKSLYLLGQISFEEGRIKTAMGDWQFLVHDYPQTPEGKEIGGRLKQLSEIVGKLSDANVTSAVARSYLSNGDFWSKSDRKFLIDASWLPEVELAVQWYDQIIREFPGSDAAELAYERNLFALIGGKEIGEDRASGLRGNYDKYLPQVLETFSSFENAFPDNPSLEAFRYQIAQAYWGHRDWTNTRLWLQKVIDKSNGVPTFYTETARARLQKIEY
jgi:tetratricopeptide (TPR) repeat protein